jgi:hypothetical protein
MDDRSLRLRSDSIRLVGPCLESFRQGAKRYPLTLPYLLQDRGVRASKTGGCTALGPKSVNTVRDPEQIDSPRRSRLAVVGWRARRIGRMAV